MTTGIKKMQCIIIINYHNQVQTKQSLNKCMGHCTQFHLPSHFMQIKMTNQKSENAKVHFSCFMNMIENTIPFSFPHFPGVGGGGGRRSPQARLLAPPAHVQWQQALHPQLSSSRHHPLQNKAVLHNLLFDFNFHKRIRTP